MARERQRVYQEWMRKSGNQQSRFGEGTSLPNAGVASAQYGSQAPPAAQSDKVVVQARRATTDIHMNRAPQNQLPADIVPRKHCRLDKELERNGPELMIPGWKG